MHRVTKTIDFCYGHRLVGHKGKCRYLHGHNGQLEVDIEAASLDAGGMVVDFGQMRDVVKGWIDAHLDHKMLLSRADPALPALEKLGEPLYVLDENPTAENICKLIFQQARQEGLHVVEVRLWETPTSRASYRE